MGKLEFDEYILDAFTGSLLITAPAGYGKTSFCRWNVLRDAQMMADKTGQILPVYVPLHRLSHDKLTSYESAFFRAPELIQLIKSRAKNTLEIRERIRVYLDGLDEISSSEKQRAIVELARQTIKSTPSVQVVITARDHVLGPWLV